jgi:hypothetical protein
LHVCHDCFEKLKGDKNVERAMLLSTGEMIPVPDPPLGNEEVYENCAPCDMNYTY